MNISDFVWLPIEEAIKKTTFKNSKKLLKKANEFITLKNVLLRSRDCSLIKGVCK